MSILSVNAGSSSLKFALYPIAGDDIACAQVTGNVEGLEPSGQPRIVVSASGQSPQTRAVALQAGEDAFQAALRELGQLLREQYADSFAGLNSP